MHNSVCCLCLQHKDSSAVDTNNWFKTGDVASIDSLGFMRITDRSKDVIKSGGEWISSIDIENAAMSHEHVKHPTSTASIPSHTISSTDIENAAISRKTCKQSISIASMPSGTLLVCWPEAYDSHEG